MPFLSARDLNVSSAAKVLDIPAPRRAAPSAIPEKVFFKLIAYSLFVLIKIFPKRRNGTYGSENLR
jgi:hypothetical protein